jgi:hypothetical protein
MKVNKTFSIDLELIEELKKLRNRNGGLRNKSAYVNAAIWNKLHDEDEDAHKYNPRIQDATAKQLMIYLRDHEDCDSFIKRALQSAVRTSD